MNDVFILVKGLEIEELFEKDVVSVEELIEKIIDLNLYLKLEREKNEMKQGDDDCEQF